MAEETKNAVQEAANNITDVLVNLEPNAITQFQTALAKLLDIFQGFDADKNGHTSAYEFFNGVIKTPQLAYILFALLSSAYGVWNLLLGFIGQEWNWVGIVFSISLLASSAIVYFGNRKTNSDHLKTYKNLNQLHDEEILAKKVAIRTLTTERDEFYEQVRAWKTKCTMYATQVAWFRKKYPTADIPDITQIEKDMVVE